MEIRQRIVLARYTVSGLTYGESLFKWTHQIPEGLVFPVLESSSQMTEKQRSCEYLAGWKKEPVNPS